MSTGEVAAHAVIAAVVGAAVVAVLVPHLRRVRLGRARFLGGRQSEKPRAGRTPDGTTAQPPEFVADAGSRPLGPPHPPRSSAAAARRKTAMTGEAFACEAASIPDRDRMNIWRELAAESEPFRFAYRWAASFGKLFVFGVLLFAASLVALLGDYSRFLLAATLLSSAILVGLPALKLHRIAWQALNLSAGVYLAALKGEDYVDE
ncbi:hypothetical protein [Amycolatopsis sp. WGS_07]|uniref:hypothetical protein n=1 Tax=Amycolatopsis sp. WGS_07 TaxID=3076764 RepID=UPI003873BCC9